MLTGDTRWKRLIQQCVTGCNWGQKRRYSRYKLNYMECTPHARAANDLIGINSLGLTDDGGGDSLLASDPPADPHYAEGGRCVSTREPSEYDPLSESGWHADQRLSQPSCGCWPLPWRRGHYGGVWAHRSH